MYLKPIFVFGLKVSHNYDLLMSLLALSRSVLNLKQNSCSIYSYGSQVKYYEGSRHTCDYDI